MTTYSGTYNGYTFAGVSQDYYKYSQQSGMQWYNISSFRPSASIPSGATLAYTDYLFTDSSGKILTVSGRGTGESINSGLQQYAGGADSFNSFLSGLQQTYGTTDLFKVSESYIKSLQPDTITSNLTGTEVGLNTTSTIDSTSSNQLGGTSGNLSGGSSGGSYQQSTSQMLQDALNQLQQSTPQQTLNNMQAAGYNSVATQTANLVNTQINSLQNQSQTNVQTAQQNVTDVLNGVQQGRDLVDQSNVFAKMNALAGRKNIRNKQNTRSTIQAGNLVKDALLKKPTLLGL